MITYVEASGLSYAVRSRLFGAKFSDQSPFYKLSKILDYNGPYKDILVYHGLGSGKTCSSIAVAESLMSNKKVYVLTPATLEENYREQIRECGDPVYAYEQHWEEKGVRSEEDREKAKALGISEKFLDKTGVYYTTVKDASPNFRNFFKSIS